MDKLKMQTIDGVQDNIKKIAQLFPDCVTETMDANGHLVRKVDVEKLLQNLSGEIISEHEERYQFTWPDKKKAILLANAPINATLRPCREESVDYDTTQNLYIEGDNLDVLKCLKETYLHKVKMIYIDPPYNTGNDFVYKDDFAESAEEYRANSGQYDEQGNRMFTNTESNGRFHTDWLNMIYPRLKVARDLLSDDGVIFISTGVEEFSNLKAICNELFGEENFIEIFSWVKTSTPPSLATKSRKTNEYILCYEKRKNGTKYDGEPLDGGDQPLLNNGNSIATLKFPKSTVLFKKNNFPNGIYKPYNSGTCSLVDEIEIVDGYATCDFRLQGKFKWTQEFLNEEIKNGTTFIIKKDELSIRFIRQGEGFKRPGNFIKEKYTSPLIDKPSCGVGTNENASSYLNKLMDNLDIFSYPKPTSLIEYIINFVCENNDLVVDFFSGSATTAEAVLKYNIRTDKKLRYILVQLPENLDNNLKSATDQKAKELLKSAISFLEKINKPHLLTELAKERIRRASKKILDDLKDTLEKKKGKLARMEDNGCNLFGQLEKPIDEVPMEEQELELSSRDSLKKEIEELEEKIANLDIGFRVLKLDSSNMQDIYYAPSEIQQGDLFAQVDNVKSDRTGEDLLFQVMLELGASLDSKIETKEVNGKTIYNVADGYLVATFDKDVNDDVVRAIADMQPLYAVMRDTSMANDSTATNFEQIFRTYSPNTVTKIL